jgi:hypothetical protein
MAAVTGRVPPPPTPTYACRRQGADQGKGLCVVCEGRVGLAHALDDEREAHDAKHHERALRA